MAGALSRGRVSDTFHKTSTMLGILRKRYSGLSVCHINAQSLPKHLDEFKLSFANANMDIVCVSETWLSSDISDIYIGCNEYEIYRGGRNLRSGGGVALFVNKNIKSKVVQSSAVNSEIEYVFVEIVCGFEKCLVAVIYKPPNVYGSSHIIDILEEITINYNHLIIAGDLNLNLLDENDPPIKQFIANLDSLHLFPTNTTQPTHFTATNSTLLDIFLVNKPAYINFYGQLDAPGFSKHDLIFLFYNIETVRNVVNNVIQYKDFKAIDKNSLLTDVLCSNLESIYYMPTVDDQVQFFTNTINNLFTTHVPLKTVVLRNKNCPWYNSRIELLISKRNAAYKRWKRYKLPLFFTEFKTARNKVNLEVRKSKTLYFSKKFNPGISSQKAWKALKGLGVGKQRDKIDDNINADDLNKTFAESSITAFSSANKSILPDPRSDISTSSASNSFGLMRVNEFEVYKAVSAIKSDAIGLDEMHPKFLKIIIYQVLPILTHIFNSILMTSTYPSLWKASKIIPVQKNSSSKQKEFRPISILPFVSKVFEKLVSTQISAYLDRFRLLSPFQSGFRPQHSCTTALIQLVDELRMQIDKDHLNSLVLLDFSKAFDTVPHNILLNKLRHNFNFESNALKLIMSYLKDRKQAVYLNSNLSSFLPISAGVPQGSILGPLFFCMFNNDLPSVLKHCSIQMYADDVQLHLSYPLGLVEDATARINEDLNLVMKWSTANQLRLNPKKSQVIVIGRDVVNTDSFPCVEISDDKIPYVNTAKILGLVFNQTLTWDDHVSLAVGKIYGTLRVLYLTCKYLPTKVKMMLVKTLLLPILLYGHQVFCDLDSISKRKLNVGFNSAVRFVYNLRRFDHISEYSDTIYGMPFETYLKYKTILCLFKIKCSGTPEYLFSKLVFSSSARSRVLIPPRYKFNVSKKQFFIFAIGQWNQLPARLRRLNDRVSFERELLRHYRS